MDDQIARMMFDTVATEVVKYRREPSTIDELTGRIKKKFRFCGDVLLKEEPDGKNIEARVYFYMNESRTDQVEVHFLGRTVEEGVVAQGMVKTGRVAYDSRPNLYEWIVS